MSALFINALARPVSQAFLRLFSRGMFCAFVFLSLSQIAFAAGPYAPGETLNPACSPGATNCIVSQLA
ncbi:MAG: hypothetical protein RLZZ347_548, partial [Candidatus Parcubacteria bacterium]